MKTIEEQYTAIGAKFITPIEEISEKLKKIKAFVYDWDGVFNNGEKGGQIGSTYKEADSMGTNLLRFAFWLTHNENLPQYGIITGANNPTAKQLADREHFPFAYIGTKDKGKALEHLCKTQNLKPEEIAFFFDDILDLSVASQVGLRFLVRRDASPAFMNYVTEHSWCDYVTAGSGNEFAVRETAELLISLYGVYNEVVDYRMQFQGKYERYLSARNSFQTSEITEADL